MFFSPIFTLALSRPIILTITSPIRRYADLLVHRALIDGLRLGDGGLDDSEVGRFTEIAEHISRTERRAVSAERDANDRYTAAFLESRMGESFSGTVRGATRAGLFVVIDDNGAEGFVPASRLPGGRPHFDMNTRILKTGHGGAYRMGDSVEIRIAEADGLGGSATFDLMKGGAPVRRKTPHKRRKSGGKDPITATGNAGRKTKAVWATIRGIERLDFTRKALARYVSVMNLLKSQSARPALMLCASAMFLLAACTQIVAPQDTDYTDSYSRLMFDTGYNFIHDRYINAVSIREISVNGLTGLRQLDSSLDIRDTAGGIAVLYNGRHVGEVAMPVTGAPDDWSTATVEAIALVRGASLVVADARAEAVFKAVFDSALKPLDRFTRYDDSETAIENRAFRDGFGGIGVVIRMEETDAFIISVNENGPAARAGVLPEDRITHVEGEPIAGWTQRKLVKTLRGGMNTPVSFSVTRENASAPIPFALKRAYVVAETASVTREDGVAVIPLSAFNIDSARRMERLVSREMRSRQGPPLGFVLDLRSNPGGRLDVSVEVADIFLDGGAITATRGRHPDSRQVFAATSGDLAKGLPVVILINGNSASAAEIVAAALQDNGRAIVIGTNSFGKGTVQSVFLMPNAGEITLTWSRFLAPSGYRLHELGVLPSVCTHGGGDTKDAETLVPAVQHGEGVLAGRLKVWRATGNSDAANRERLREICPSDNGRPDVDMALAKAIIADGTLYRALLQKAETSVANR